MKFHPHNNHLLLKKVKTSNPSPNCTGLILKMDEVDLYEVVEIPPTNESKKNQMFQVGDIVTACATGTELKDNEGNKFVLMNADYITSKLV